jgi:O-antigen/teichoic acid export membrane protein
MKAAGHGGAEGTGPPDGDPKAVKPDADWVQSVLGLPREVRAGVVAGWASSAAQIVTGVVVPSVLVRVLGMASYGRYVFLLSLVGYMGLLDAGLTTTLVARFGQARASNHATGPIALLRTGLAWVLVTSVAAVLVAVAAGSRWSPQLLLAWWFVAAAGITLAAELLGSVVRGYGRTDRYNAVTAAATLLNGVGSCGAVLCGYSILGLAAAQLASAALRLVALLWLAWRALPVPSALVLGPLVNPVRDLSIGLSDQVTRLWLNLLSPSLRILLAGVGGTVALATYDLASRLVSAVVIPPSVFLPVLLPAFASRASNGKAVRELLSQSVTTFQALVLPGFVFVGFFAEPLARAWVGSCPQDLVFVTRILLLANCWNLSTGPFSQALLGAGRPKLCNQKAVLGLLLSLGLSLPLVLLAGLRGYACGEATTHLVAASWFLVRYRTVMPINALAFVLRTFASGLKRLVPAAVAAVLVYGLTKESSAWTSFLGWALLFGLFGVLAWAPWSLRAKAWGLRG